MSHNPNTNAPRRQPSRAARWLAAPAIGALILSGAATTSATAGAWPGDNGRIVFTGIADAQNPAQQLYVADSNGANMIELTVGTAVEKLYANPSPDGTKVVYTQRAISGDYSTWMLNVGPSGGSGNRQIQIAGAEESFLASFSPTGQELVVVTGKEIAGQQQVEMVVTDLDGNIKRVIPAPVPVVPNYEPIFPQWSPDGEWISFNDRDGTPYRVAADAATPPEPLIGPVNLNQEIYGGMSWSPDGQQLLYSTDDVNGRRDLWVMNRDGTNPRAVTNTPNEEESYASWSPDGSKLLYSTQTPATGPVISISNVDGSNPTPVTTTNLEVAVYPVWMPIPYETTLSVKAVKKSKKLKVGDKYKVVKSAETNGEITNVKIVCKTNGDKVSGKQVKKVCGAKEKKKDDPTTTKVIAKPKCDSKVRIKAVVTAEYANADPMKWKRTWKVKNNTGPGCAS